MKTEEFLACGYSFIQDDDCFKLGTDTVLLSGFAKLMGGYRVCDLGCGAGFIPLLLLGRRGDITVDGVEKDAHSALLAVENVRRNALEDKITVREGDLRDAESLFGGDRYDLVISNPPYFSAERGRISQKYAAARSETECSLGDICRQAGRLLKTGGSFSVVYRVERMAELIYEMKQNRLEPKRLRYVADKRDSAPSVFLMDARKGGGSGLKLMPTLIIRDEDGAYTKEILEIYGRG